VHNAWDLGCTVHTGRVLIFWTEFARVNGWHVELWQSGAALYNHLVRVAVFRVIVAFGFR
jgi:hypothetical protein